jgi:hypothetical protein
LEDHGLVAFRVGSAILKTQVSFKEENVMCDYSLAGLPNRLAVEGEQLVVHRFVTGVKGLAPACPGLKQLICPSSTPAVCIPPGAQLRLYDIPLYLQQRLGVGEVEKVSFVQQSAEAFTYRDAVRFANGQELLLQYLQCGQRVDVRSLSPGENGEEEAERRCFKNAEVFGSNRGNSHLS